MTLERFPYTIFKTSESRFLKSGEGNRLCLRWSLVPHPSLTRLPRR